MNWATILYKCLVVLHIFSLVGWFGLSTGAWLLLRKIERDTRPEVLWPAFAKVVDAEHHFLAVLILSGIGMAAMAGFGAMLHVLWFVLKLGIIMCVLIPVECADIVLTMRLKRDPSPERIAAYKRFLAYGGATIVAAALAIVVLAKFQPL